MNQKCRCASILIFFSLKVGVLWFVLVGWIEFVVCLCVAGFSLGFVCVVVMLF